MKDKIGQEIVPGSIIAYGVGRGELQMGKVIKFSSKVVNRYNFGNYDQYKITVCALHKKFDKLENRYYYEAAERTSTLQFPSRMVVVANESLPLELREAADRIKV